ncbi:aminotransferase class III-fold pyridoxal phosphate-dependent enzyme [Flavitalea flava]
MNKGKGAYPLPEYDHPGDLHIEGASGAYLHTSSGRQLLDFSSGVLTYQHPLLVEEVKKNLLGMSLSGRMFFSAPLATLAARLSAFFPEGKAVAYPCNSATEAMEGALKLAMGFHKGRRFKIIGVEGVCQGNTLGALSISGIAGIRDHFEQLPLQASFVAFGEPASMLEAIDDSVAAVIIEPVLLSDRFQLLPGGYISAVRKACDRHGTILIINESLSGFGRLGPWFAWQAANSVPDILVTGNMLGGNMIPYGAYIAKSEINNAVYKREDPALHGATTAGFPMGCAVACRVLDLLEKAWKSGALRLGERLLTIELEKIQTVHPDLIREIQIRGLLAGIRFRDAGTAGAFFNLACEQSLLLHNCATGQNGSAWLVILPPLLVTEEELAAGLLILTSCLEIMETGDHSDRRQLTSTLSCDQQT